MTVEPSCKGNQSFDAHAMIELGQCPHEVGGATYIYAESACPDCGATARKVEVFACGTRKAAVRPTAENCLSLKWKAERAEATA